MKQIMNLFVLITLATTLVACGPEIPKMLRTCDTDTDCHVKGGVYKICSFNCLYFEKSCARNEDCPNGQKCREGSASNSNQKGVCVFDTTCTTTADCNANAKAGSIASFCQGKFCIEQKCKREDTDACKSANPPKSCFSCPNDQTCKFTDDSGKDIRQPYCVTKPKSECADGDTRSCYTGPEGTKNIGACKAGTQTCKNGTWDNTTCEGEVLPTKEICKDNLDQDCNGRADDAAECQTGECSPGDTRSCYTGPAGTQDVGICKAGIQTCTPQKKWGSCANEVLPGKEICDKKDNNCDGDIDELPECKQECTNGKSRACYSGNPQTRKVGSCKDGRQTCVNGTWGSCTGELLPTTEVCNGKDDNCDGKTDETFSNLGNNCFAGKGECKMSGTYICSKDQQSTECNATPNPPSKEICDGKDNDCDGTVDNNGANCAEKCVSGNTRTCYTGTQGTAGTGPCKTGMQTCSNEKWGPCVGQVISKTELCDNIDNDCDGKTDEDFINLGDSCNDGVGECKASGKFICSTDKTKTVCNAKPKQPSQEVCDGKDNNCDGSVDEGTTKACSTACGTGQEKCVNGKLEACNAPKPQQETCNGKDDDCNGTIDDGLMNSCPPTIAQYYTTQNKCYQMGSPTTETGRDPQTEIQTKMCFSKKGLAIGVYEVTCKQFETLMGYNPCRNVVAGCTQTDCPVENISIHEAAIYTNKLSKQQNLQECYTCTGSKTTASCTAVSDYYGCTGYRLPTEAEWEWAARAGGTHAGSNHGNLLLTCNYYDNSRRSTQRVGQKQPNNWKLHDMLGNVWEMTWDRFVKIVTATTDPLQAPTNALSKRVLKGCSFQNQAGSCRFALRLSSSTTASNSKGFRVFRTLIK